MRIVSSAKPFLISVLLLACNIVFAQTPAPGPGTTATPAPVAAPPKPIAAAPTNSATPTPAPGTAPVAPKPRVVTLPKLAEIPPPTGYTGPVWKKQVTRDIEMGDRMDSTIHRLRDASPDNTLLEMFAIGIKSGKLSAFYSSDFSMVTRLRIADFNKLFVGKRDTLAMRDASGKYVAKIVNREFSYSQVHKYRILEEWTSYPGIGQTEVQIVGISPLMDVRGDDGVVHGVNPLFWVHFTDDIKAIVARYDQYHPNNTLGGHIWNDYFSGQR